MLNKLLLAFMISCMAMGQFVSESFCSQVMPNSRILIAENERREILLRDYIKGFNLSYSVDHQGDGIQLSPALQIISSVSTLCRSGDIQLISTDQVGTSWGQRIATLESDGTQLCLSVGRINPDRSVVFEQLITIEGIFVSDCLSLTFLSDGSISVGCQNGTHGTFWRIAQQEVSFNSFELIEPLVKILQYDQYQMMVLSAGFLRIYDTQQTLKLIKEYNSSDFGKQSMNMTDIIVGRQIVITDYLYGCFKFSLDSTLSIVGLDNYQVKDSFTLKIAASDSRYYVMSKMEISEVFWTDNFRIGEVYQIPEFTSVREVLANQRLVTIEFDHQLYIYQRGVTRVNEVIAKYVGHVKPLLHPTELWMLLYLNGQVHSISTDVSYLSIATTSSQSITIQAISHDSLQSSCQAQIQIQPITDLLKVYHTLNTLKPSFTIPIKTSLVMPVGNYYEGLNLSYTAHNEDNVNYNLKRATQTPLISIYSKNPLLLTKEIDQFNFYRLTTDVGSINIQRCLDRQTNILCTPLRTKKIGVRIIDLRLFDSVVYGCLLTYITEDPYSIFIQDITGKISKKLQLYQPNEFTVINDYSISNEYIFITHQLLNRIDVYSLTDFSLVGGITNSIVMGKLFRPKRVMVSHSHPQLIYIRNVNSLLLVNYNGEPTLLGEVPIKVKTLAQDWTFIHDMSTLIIVYTDTIQEWSLNSIEKPVFLKQFPLMNMQISKPIVLDYTNQYLVIECNGNQLLMLKTGVSAISSVFLVLEMPAPSTFHLVSASQLLLMYNNGQQRIVQRIYPDIQLEVTPSYQDTNEFVESFPIRFQVSSSAQTKNMNSQLKVVNYQKELKQSSRNNDSTEMPTTANQLVIELDDLNWFAEGAVIWYQLECDYCPDRFVPTYHSKRFGESKGIRESQQLMLWDNNSICVLTNGEIIVTDLSFNLIRPPISGLNEECSHINRNRQWLLAFCKEPNRQGYFLPMSMLTNHPVILQPILIDRDYEVQHVLKSAFIGDRYMVLDQNITGDGTGLIRIFKTVPTESGLSMQHEVTLDGAYFNYSKDTKINGFQLERLQEDTYRAYFTLSTVGIVTCRILFADTVDMNCLINDYLMKPPGFMSPYLTDDDQILQLKVISTDINGINATHASLTHVVVVTHAQSAHFELSLRYVELLSDRSLLSVETSLVQAFNRYGTQLILNWLEATRFNSQSTNNMFLVSYYNSSRYSVSMGIYPLTQTYGFIKNFQNIKGGSFIETTDLGVFSAVLMEDESGQPLILNNLLPNINMNRRSQPVINHLSNRLKVTATYDKPSDDQYILFRATNDYSQATYKFPITFPVQKKFAWYWILVAVGGFLLLAVVACLGYRRYRIKKQQQEKESLLASLQGTEPPDQAITGE